MHFTCPFCRRDQIVTNGQNHSFTRKLELQSNRFDDAVIEIRSIACSNTQCGEIALDATLFSGTTNAAGRWNRTGKVGQWKLRPSSYAKPQPPCVPEQISQDYYEACAIRDLSPKASATLARRCLQGMIRDFCKVSKPTLFAEIAELRALVEGGNAPAGVLADSLEAIDAVRSVGNIGAHMEKDINIIVDVDPDEAQTLIELIELLFADWYIARDERQRRLARVKSVADAKRAAASPEAALGEAIPGIGKSAN